MNKYYDRDGIEMKFTDEGKKATTMIGISPDGYMSALEWAENYFAMASGKIDEKRLAMHNEFLFKLGQLERMSIPELLKIAEKRN